MIRFPPSALVAVPVLKSIGPVFRLGVAAFFFSAFLHSAAQAEGLAELWRVDGFVFPEATEVLPDGTIAISDRGAGGTGADGRIALIAANGTPIALDWVTGLVNPFGMTVSGGRLYVVDGAVGLQVIDIATGRLLDPILLPEARLPNDIAAGPGGTLYVTDTIAGGVMQVRNGVAAWLSPPGTTPAANGIVWSADRIVVGTMGDNLNPADFSVTAPGGLLSVDPATGNISQIKATKRSASVDGVVQLDGMLVWNDNPTGRVLALGEAGVIEIGRTEPESGALSGSGTLLVIPQLRAGYVAAYRLDRPMTE
ncbi:hypothetical protein [Tropicimonas sp.]|uniref:hypothetical protein n=1 Tax=Tropicimonas sp. TaxID=2067044 RepID=UPI003A85EE90